MIWDIIRDFIVQYITGGSLSSGDLVHTTVGYDLEYDTSFGTDNLIMGKVGNGFDGGDIFIANITFGDWLATTLTIICMCLIVVFAIWLVRWVFKAVSSAFLLK